jgi:hypothetical protein
MEMNECWTAGERSFCVIPRSGSYDLDGTEVTPSVLCPLQGQHHFDIHDLRRVSVEDIWALRFA